MDNKVYAVMEENLTKLESKQLSPFNLKLTFNKCLKKTKRLLLQLQTYLGDYACSDDPQTSYFAVFEKLTEFVAWTKDILDRQDCQDKSKYFDHVKQLIYLEEVIEQLNNFIISVKPN